jgi:hypothetical protein
MPLCFGYWCLFWTLVFILNTGVCSRCRCVWDTRVYSEHWCVFRIPLCILDTRVYSASLGVSYTLLCILDARVHFGYWRLFGRLVCLLEIYIPLGCISVWETYFLREYFDPSGLSRAANYRIGTRVFKRKVEEWEKQVGARDRASLAL